MELSELSSDFLYFCLFKKLNFVTIYQIGLIEIYQGRSDFLDNGNGYM